MRMVRETQQLKDAEVLLKQAWCYVAARHLSCNQTDKVWKDVLEQKPHIPELLIPEQKAKVCFGTCLVFCIKFIV